MSTSSRVSGKEEAISSNLVISILVFMSVVLGFTSCLFVLRLRGLNSEV